MTLTRAAASVDTATGIVATAWDAAPPNTGTCVVVPEHANATLACLGGGSFTAVSFASFGTPTGACPSTLAYSSCNANTSMAVAAAACVGKSSCSIAASDTVFGDPCPNVPKSLAVSLAGPCDQIVFTLSATVPAGSTATAYVPVADASTAVITEGGAKVWASGAFVPGTPGVLGAAPGVGAHNGTVAIAIGSGEYAFAIGSAGH